MGVFSFSFEGIFHLPLDSLLSLQPDVKHRPVGGAGGRVPDMLFPYLLFKYFPSHTHKQQKFSLSESYLNKAWGWVGGWRWMFVIMSMKKCILWTTPWDEDQEKQMGEMLKCLQLISWQGRLWGTQSPYDLVYLRAMQK